MKHHKKHNSKKLVTADVALKKFLSSVHFIPRTEIISLKSATSRVLAKDIVSNIEIPSFDKAAMDGFAIKSSDTNKASRKNPITLKVVGKIFAGSRKKNFLKKGEALAVATGSPLPSGANAVIMVEDVFQNRSSVKISKRIKNHENVALRGEEVKKTPTNFEKRNLVNTSRYWSCCFSWSQ